MNTSYDSIFLVPNGQTSSSSTSHDVLNNHNNNGKLNNTNGHHSGSSPGLDAKNNNNNNDKGSTNSRGKRVKIRKITRSHTHGPGDNNKPNENNNNRNKKQRPSVSFAAGPQLQIPADIHGSDVSLFPNILFRTLKWVARPFVAVTFHVGKNCSNAIVMVGARLDDFGLDLWL